MVTKDDIHQLSILARISISKDEEISLAKDLDSVLEYVSDVSGVATEEDIIPRVGSLYNVMRVDDNPYPGGEYTENFLKNAPDTQDGYVKVKQIF